MSNIHILDLPTLSVDNFNPDSDFVIVQRPGRGIYKILASEVLSVSKNVADRKRGARDIILEESVNQSGANSNVIIFDHENLLEKDTSWQMQITLKILSDASGFDRNIRNTGQYFGVYGYLDLPAIGDQRFMNISKPRNSNLINQRYLVGKKETLAEKFEFGYRHYEDVEPGPGKKMGYADKNISYSVIFDTQEQNKIKLSFHRSGDGHSSPFSNVQFNVTLTAKT